MEPLCVNSLLVYFNIKEDPIERVDFAATRRDELHELLHLFLRLRAATMQCAYSQPSDAVPLSSILRWWVHRSVEIVSYVVKGTLRYDS